MKSFWKFLVCLGFIVLACTLGPAVSVRAASLTVPCNDIPALIAAINTANSTPEPDTIQLADDCTYLLDSVDNTGAEFGPNGLPVITTKIIFTAQTPARLKRVGRYAGTPFRFFLVAPTGVLVLRNLEISYGRTGMTATPGVAFSGGGIYNNGGKVNLKNTRLWRNRVNSEGIGYGGGIYNDAGTVKWVGSEVGGNDGGHGGGGIYNNGKLAVKDSTIWVNKAQSGGGILNLDRARVQRTTFRNNRIPASLTSAVLEGGAISNHGTMDISASRFQDNSGPQRGGAIANRKLLQVLNSTFFHNKARDGGAIWNLGDAILANNTFNQNTAARYGGALYNRGTMELFNLTLAENQAIDYSVDGSGGNIFASSEAATVVANTIITQGYPQNCVGALDVQGGNLRFPESDATCEGEYGDPMLDVWGKNGSPTEVMPLKPGSRAISKGLRENCLRQPVNNLDQRGVTRIMGNEERCESGAYELE